MPIINNLYSVEFINLTDNKKMPLPEFSTKLQAFTDAWDSRPVHDPDVKGTLKQKVYASREQEIDELLVLSPQASRYATEKCTRLLAAGASVNAKGFLSKKPALIWAAESRNTTLVSLMVAHGVDLSLCWYKSGDALTCAACYSLEMVKVLVEAGAVIDGARDNWFRNALGVAVWANKLDIVKYLVDHGANINLQDPTRGCAALHYTPCTHKKCEPTRVNRCYYDAPAIPVQGEFINCNVPMISLLAKLGADLSLTCMTRPQGNGAMIQRRRVMFCDEARDELCAMVHLLIAERRLAVAMALHPRIGEGAKMSILLVEVVQIVLNMPHSSCSLELDSLTSALFANVLATR